MLILGTAPADGSAKLVLALDAILNRDSPTSDYPMAVPTREPAETNFFPYLEQFPGGETAMLVARDLFYWAQGVADEVAFAGLIQPGFHARVNTASTMATVFSVWAYRRRPSAQLPLDLLAGRHPFDNRLARREVLNKLNQLLPSAAQLPLGKVDKRPTFPLYHLSSAETLEGFKAIVLGIIGDLRDADSS